MRLVLAEHNAVSFEANVTQLQSLKLDTLVAAVLDGEIVINWICYSSYCPKIYLALNFLNRHFINVLFVLFCWNRCQSSNSFSLFG